MTTIEQYKQDNGYYDTTKIRTDAGMNDRSALAADIFGSMDEGPKHELQAPYQALLDEAERRNAEMLATAAQAKETEARTLMAAPEPWSRETWRRLVELRFAVRDIEDGGEQGSMTTSYRLTGDGERLLDPAYRTPGLYADQVGIDGAQ